MTARAIARAGRHDHRVLARRDPMERVGGCGHRLTTLEAPVLLEEAALVVARPSLLDDLAVDNVEPRRLLFVAMERAHHAAAKEDGANGLRAIGIAIRAPCFA